MARINIDDGLFGGPRYQKFLIKIGDRHKALGQIVDLFKIAQSCWYPEKKLIPRQVFDEAELSDLLIECGLATEKDGHIYAHGSEEHFEWLFKNKENGKKGGRPRKNPVVTDGIPSANPRGTDKNPLPLPPTLSPIKNNNICDGVDEPQAEAIVEKWNKCSPDPEKIDFTKGLKKIIEDKVINPFFTRSGTEVLQAIENYFKVFRDDRYYYNIDWSLVEFLSNPKTDKFYPGSFKPQSMVDKKKINKSGVNRDQIMEAARGSIQIKDLGEKERGWIEKNGGSFHLFQKMSEYELNKMLAAA